MTHDQTGDPDLNPEEPSRTSPPMANQQGEGSEQQTGGEDRLRVPEETDAERPFEDAFMGRLRERLVTRPSPRYEVGIDPETDIDPEKALSKLADTLPTGALENIEDGWERLQSDAGLRRNSSHRGDRDRPRRIQTHQAATSLRDNFQAHVLAIHGFATFVLLGIGIGIIISAGVQIVPPEFWILSLPLILLAIAGLLPLAGWVFGFWNPQQV